VVSELGAWIIHCRIGDVYERPTWETHRRGEQNAAVDALAPRVGDTAFSAKQLSILGHPG
jgi:hypothetical protein